MPAAKILQAGQEWRITMIGQTIAAALGTVAFSVLFGVPRKYYGYCGLVGGAGWCLYSILTVYTACTAVEATFFATFLVVLLSRFLAVWEKCPATVFDCRCISAGAGDRDLLDCILSRNGPPDGGGRQWFCGSQGGLCDCVGNRSGI